MAHTYAHLCGVPTISLRDFPVYGPWDRPDMATFVVTRRIPAGESIDEFNHGRMRRDVTDIDDSAEGVVHMSGRPAEPDPAWSGEVPIPAISAAPWRLGTNGDHALVELVRLFEPLGRELGREAIDIGLPMRPGDMPALLAKDARLQRAVGFVPSTPSEEGVRGGVGWSDLSQSVMQGSTLMGEPRPVGVPSSEVRHVVALVSAGALAAPVDHAPEAGTRTVGRAERSPCH